MSLDNITGPEQEPMNSVPGAMLSITAAAARAYPPSSGPETAAAGSGDGVGQNQGLFRA